MSCSLERVCTVGPDQTTFGSTRFITIHRLKDAHIKIFVAKNIMFGYLFSQNSVSDIKINNSKMHALTNLYSAR